MFGVLDVVELPSGHIFAFWLLLRCWKYCGELWRENYWQQTEGKC